MTATGETKGNTVKWQCEDNGEHGEKQLAAFTGSLSSSGSEIKGDWTTVIKGTFSGTRVP